MKREESIMLARRLRDFESDETKRIEFITTKKPMKLCDNYDIKHEEYGCTIWKHVDYNDQPLCTYVPFFFAYDKYELIDLLRQLAWWHV